MDIKTKKRLFNEKPENFVYIGEILLGLAIEGEKRNVIMNGKNIMELITASALLDKEVSFRFQEQKMVKLMKEEEANKSGIIRP